MSVTRLAGRSRKQRTLSSSAPSCVIPWVRPSDWIDLPILDNAFTGTFAVFNDDSNYVALTASGSGGYTVDWGDGTVDNWASAAVAQHSYTYSAISASTACSRGYRQVLVKVYPQSGKTITSLSLNQVHATTTYTNSQYQAPWLDIAINIPTLTLFGSGTDSYQTIVGAERIAVYASAATSLAYWFDRFHQLVTVPVLNTGTLTTMNNAFYQCESLRILPWLDTGSVTTFSMAFYGCYSLAWVPNYQTGSCLNFSSAFYGCTSLIAPPAFDTHSATDFSSMFQTCRAMQTGPSYDTSKATTLSAMFSSCNSMRTLPAFDASLATSMNGTFTGCYCLQEFPSYSAHASSTTVDYSNAFSTCPSLRRAPISGCKNTISFANCRLGPAGLNEIFTALGTGTGKTITITNNWGAATCDRSIATAKGWTVTG